VVGAGTGEGMERTVTVCGVSNLTKRTGSLPGVPEEREGTGEGRSAKGALRVGGVPGCGSR